MLFLKILLALAVALEFLFVPLFLKAMWPKKTKKSLALKMVCTFLFISTGFLAVAISGNTTAFAHLMLSGLVLGGVGDFFLHASSKPAFFITGLMSFLCGHICYISAFWWVTKQYFPGVNFINPAEMGAILLIYASFVIYAIYKKNDFGSALVPVILYAASLITMFVKASSLGIRLATVSTPNATLICIVLIGGALQFFMSDSLWANINFNGHKKSRSMKNANIITYFGAQVLLACTILVIS
ncbi:MAG: lysoplasmalogenase family protein [Eubacteriales bacterium]